MTYTDSSDSESMSASGHSGTTSGQISVENATINIRLQGTMYYV